MSQSELFRELQHHIPHGSSKVMSKEAMLESVERMRKSRSSIKIGWTSGCFDLLHVAHADYLRAAKTMCDVLVVGINSDVSVRMLKGPTRPIITDNDRAELLSALTAVDIVVIFDEKSPIDIMRSLRPDIFFKGPDYTLAQLNKQECSVVENGGGIVKIVGKRKQHTTSLIEKIKGL